MLPLEIRSEGTFFGFRAVVSEVEQIEKVALVVSRHSGTDNSKVTSDNSNVTSYAPWHLRSSTRQVSD